MKTNLIPKINPEATNNSIFIVPLMIYLISIIVIFCSDDFHRIAHYVVLKGIKLQGL